MANQENRNLLKETVIQFCLNNNKISVQDDGRFYLILMNEKSISVEFISYEVDHEGFGENFDFELLITVWGEITTDSLLTNQIRDFIKSLSDRIILALEEKKVQDRIIKQNEKAILLKQKEAKKAMVNDVRVYRDEVFIWS